MLWNIPSVLYDIKRIENNAKKKNCNDREHDDNEKR